MSRSLLGMHWIRVHPDQHDYAHIEKMQYRSAKLFEWHWNNRDACRDLLTVLPDDAYILARDHPMSEQKGDMFVNPEGTGVRHANEWAIKVATGNVHTPIHRTFFLGINEPDATTGDRNAIDRYTAAFLDRLRVHGLRGGAFNFSTGHPRTVDGTGATQADYSVFERSHQAIVEGHHIAVLHIYGTANVPCAPGHYDRLKACPWQDVEWVVGECGADEHVVGGGNHDGYLRTLGASEAYCRWLDDFIMGVNDPRIHSYQVFSYDFSHPWDSFDIRQIRPQLEGYRWQHATQAPAPTPTAPQPATATMFVTAPSGLNLRASPDGDVLIAIPFGELVSITGVPGSANNGWLRAAYAGHTGWISAAHVSSTPPASVGTPPEVDEPTPAAVPQLAHPIADATKRIISQRFGENGHRGIDFAVPVGTPIVAVDAGTVIESMFDESGYGEYVKAKHQWGESLYAHLTTRSVAPGASVVPGYQVGLSGNTGNSTGPHLHFAIRINPYNRANGWDGYSDPLPYLPGTSAPAPTTDVLSAIKAAAFEFVGDWQLLASQAWAESSWNARAVSSAGAKGLMQIMAPTWDEWSRQINAGNDPFDARQNARVGAVYMQWLLRKTNGDVYQALHAYVWGIARISNNEIPPDEVVAYAAKIVHGRDLLKAVMG